MIRLTINKNAVSYAGKLDVSFADFLHLEQGLSGTRVCCAIGVCKSCTTVMRNSQGSPWRRLQACITPMALLKDKEILTVEGLADNGNLHPLQIAFMKHHAFQCGYSTSGFLMGGFLVLEQLQKKKMSESEIEKIIETEVSSHVCRCSGYTKYHNAIREVALDFNRSYKESMNG